MKWSGKKWILGQLLWLPSLSGCTLFASYPARTEQARQYFERGEFEKALEAFYAPSSPPDEFLHHLERGMIAHVAGMFERSNEEFFAADEALQAWEGRPTVSMRSGIEELGTLILNDKALPYDGESFERVLLHDYMALNFYALGNFDNAYVETKRAYRTQKYEEQRFEKSYPTLGAFAHYLTAIVRESVGEFGEAYVGYQLANAASPQCAAVQRDLLRLSRKLGYGDDYEKWKQALAAQGDIASDLSETGDLLLLFQCGLSPMKHPFELPVPHANGISKFAMPHYLSRSNPVASARLFCNGEFVGETEILEDIEAIATKNLEDRITWILLRAAARTTGKAVLTEKLHEKHGGWGALLGILFSWVTEQADLRSWLTLPRNIQLFRSSIPAGVYRLEIELLAADGKVIEKACLGDYEIRQGERIVLNVRSIENSTFSAVIGGVKVDSEKEGMLP